MAEIKFNCPHCGQHLKGEDDVMGVSIDCPSCGGRITVARLLTAPSAAAPAPGKRGARTRTPGAAVGGLILGLFGLVVPPLAVPAVLCSHLARSRIRKSAGALQGASAALTGLVLGYTGIAVLLVLVAVAAVRFQPRIDRLIERREAGRRETCFANLRRIEKAKEQAAILYNLRKGDVVPDNRLAESIKGGVGSLKCPEEGQYIVNPVGTVPACSIHGSLGSAPRPEPSGKK